MRFKKEKERWYEIGHASGEINTLQKTYKKKGSGRRAPRERAGADREARNWRCAAHFRAAILPCMIHFDMMNVRY